ncbi:MAG TPA: hypothetical protein VKR52_17915 [Terracidiphilus sp.]|nr:hypothetical protein [Terracidiphilus sp.]
MEPRFDDTWVASQVARTMSLWTECAGQPMPDSPRYGIAEHAQREAAYDRALNQVEALVKRPGRGQAGRTLTQQKMIAVFAQFAAHALDLEPAAIALIENEFLPAGTCLARWARRFDPALSMADIVQACRNAWTACGLQPILGEPIGMTTSILGYSLLYPYTDNYLDRREIGADAKLKFSARFRQRLRGESMAPLNSHEVTLWKLVELIERQFPRTLYDQVFDCLLAIHQAQEASLAQMRPRIMEQDEVLRISCAKGGTSVLADACLARGWLRREEAQFGFAWGVLLQLGDDLQDLDEDLKRGSTTIFSKSAATGEILDPLVCQLLNLSERVGDEMRGLPHASAMLENLLRMSWRSLIIGAVANAPDSFSSEFLAEAESRSPFRFAFLRERKKKLAGKSGLYENLFNLFLESEDENQIAFGRATAALDMLSA